MQHTERFLRKIFLQCLKKSGRTPRGIGTIKEWFEHIESYGKMLKEQNKKNGEKEGVNLMTMHAAKGLEFDTVFVIEANEGSCPYKKATADEENRRSNAGLFMWR